MKTKKKKVLTDVQMDRACGTLVGAAVGDALGAGYEFAFIPPDLTPDMIGGGLGDFAPGEWTDDTSLTWCVARVAAEGGDLRGAAPLSSIARRFRAWYDTNPPDIGGTTAFALRGAGTSPTAATAFKAAHEILGNTNGSLMRTAPVALAHLDDPKACAEAAMKVSALTHAGRDAQEACALWSLAIRHAVLTGEFELAAGTNYLPATSRDRWLKRIIDAETRSPNSFSSNGTAVGALQAAWSSIVSTPAGAYFECEHLEDTLTTAIKIGHDTDTVASIAGALLGARWGLSAIPGDWRSILHGYPGKNGYDLEVLASLIVQGGEGSKYDWPLTDHINYTYMQFDHTAKLVPHPHDEGVLLGGATHLDAIPEEVDVVISLCRVGARQFSKPVEHLNFRIYDEPDRTSNPNLEFVLVDAAETIRDLRAQGKTILLHCVAARSRTPSVAIAYSMLLGHDLNEAWAEVMTALPHAKPNEGFRRVLRELETDYFEGIVDTWFDELVASGPTTTDGD